MHDVGKMGIPDQILLKPGRLTAEEFEVMKKHPKIGHDILGGFDLAGASVGGQHRSQPP